MYLREILTFVLCRMVLRVGSTMLHGPRGFLSPTVETMCRTLEPRYWCADNDYGEYFLNFPLSPELQQYCGLDLLQLFPKEAEKMEDILTAIWIRNAMGLKQSPYAAVQGSLRAKMVIQSNVGLGEGMKIPLIGPVLERITRGAHNMTPDWHG
mmetsp:Transcript_22808/g.34552  ORF Transcript_22808/g.34552 Transcript_22808/m.34552 type:complete len:153 (+) Transcript_22808:913-1371(+)